VCLWCVWLVECDCGVRACGCVYLWALRGGARGDAIPPAEVGESPEVDDGHTRYSPCHRSTPVPISDFFESVRPKNSRFTVSAVVTQMCVIMQMHVLVPIPEIVIVQGVAAGFRRCACALLSRDTFTSSRSGLVRGLALRVVERGRCKPCEPVGAHRFANHVRRAIGRIGCAGLVGFGLPRWGVARIQSGMGRDPSARSEHRHWSEHLCDAVSA
jgi:hypothetical protein